MTLGVMRMIALKMAELELAQLACFDAGLPFIRQWDFCGVTSMMWSLSSWWFHRETSLLFLQKWYHNFQKLWWWWGKWLLSCSLSVFGFCLVLKCCFLSLFPCWASIPRSQEATLRPWTTCPFTDALAGLLWVGGVLTFQDLS